MNLSDNLVGQKCRPANSATDFFYEVVACWLQPPSTALGVAQLKIAVVADVNGKTNVLNFTDLEFDTIKTPGQLYK